MSFRPKNPSDLYQQDGFPGWQAASGDYIEVWDEGAGNRYVELHAHFNAYGVKQQFNMLPGSRLDFIVRYKGRYEFGTSYDNSFKLEVEGASDLLVNGSPAEVAGSKRHHSLMGDDDWEKYKDWHYASVSISTAPGTTGLTQVTLTLVPKKTSTYVGEEITRGCFVDILSMKFDAISGRINNGFDPPMGGLPNNQPPVPGDASSEMPWASAVRGRATDNQNVRFLLPQPMADKTKLKIVSGSADLSLTPNESPLSAPETTLTLTGLNPANMTIATAQVEAQLFSNSQKMTALNVMILPERTVSLGIYRVTDPNSAGTSPVGGPTNDEILNTLKEIYKQAGITFRLDGSGDRSVSYDNNPKDGKVQDADLLTVSPVLTNEAGKIHIYLLRNSGKVYDEDPTKFQRAKMGIHNGKPYCALYVQTILDSGGTVERVTAHEIGHIFDLSSRNSDSRDHDPGPFPKSAGADGLMKSGAPVNGILPTEPGIWLPHEDWEHANIKADEFK